MRIYFVQIEFLKGLLEVSCELLAVSCELLEMGNDFELEKKISILIPINNEVLNNEELNSETLNGEALINS